MAGGPRPPGASRNGSAIQPGVEGGPRVFAVAVLARGFHWRQPVRSAVPGIGGAGPLDGAALSPLGSAETRGRKTYLAPGQLCPSQFSRDAAANSLEARNRTGG